MTKPPHKSPRHKQPTLDEQQVLDGLVVRLLRKEERGRFHQQLRAHHYLKGIRFVGEQLNYVVEYQGQWLALLVWNAAAKHLAAREKWIGWSDGQRERRLALVANNSRFCILPEGRYPNLASRAMSLCLNRLAPDWEAAYGHPVAVVESFVDSQLFRGTAYKVSGWEEVGQTQGFGRTSQDYYTAHARPKALWVRELVPGARRQLRARTLPTGWSSVEQKARARAAYTVPEMRALVERFAQVPDWRHRRVKPYPVAGLLAIVALATLCGPVLGQRDLADFAKKLSQPQLRALGVRWDGPSQRYPHPGASTFFRLLSEIPAERIQPILLAWQEEVLGPLSPEETLLVVDGKELKSAQGLQLVSVIAALRQRWLGTEPIAVKSNEIPAARRLLTPLDLLDKIVVFDALHTQWETGQQVVFEQGGHYLLTVKNNQKGLAKTIRTLLHEQGFPPRLPEAITAEPNRSRLEIRTLRLAPTTPEQVVFPAAAQMGWLRRIKFDYPKQKRTFEAVAVLTSAPAERLEAEQFLSCNRRYWRIEGAFHQRLDGAAREDKSRVRHRNAAFLLGLFRRLAVSLAADWIAEHERARPLATQDFFNDMSAHNHRAAFALVRARRPRLPLPS